MVFYEDDVRKVVQKNKIPRGVLIHMNNALRSIDLTKDFSLFDIKTLKGEKSRTRTYYRLRKGRYRAIFYAEKGNLYVIRIAKREEVYKKWQ